MRIRFAVVLLAAALGCKSKRSEPVATTGSGSAIVADAASASTAVELPEVGGPGFDHADTKPDLSVTMSAVLLDGKPVATIVDGAGAPADTGGGTRAEIEPLVRALANRPAPARFTLALDRRLTYRALFQVVSSVAATNVRSFALLATHGGETLAVPIEAAATNQPALAPIARRVATVDAAATTVSPETSLSDSAIKMKVANAYIPPIKNCLASVGARTDAPPRETIELGFTIDDTGHTTDVTANGTSAAGADCLVTAVKAWMFPVPKDGELVPTQMTAKVTVDATYEPVAGAAAAPPTAPAAPALGMTISVSASEVSVWSTSSLEGTSRAPLVREPLGPAAVADVERALTGVVKRRFAGGQRSDTDKAITVMVDSTVTLQAVAELLGVARRAADGTELFSQVHLASGPQ